MSSELEPPEKKLKITDNLNINNIYTETIDECIEQITSSEENLQPIISDEFYQPIPLIKVFAGHIRNVKDISRTILILNEKIPLKELSHLKRVYRRDIILCPTTFLQNTSSIQEYIENHVTELKDVFEYFKEVDVPMLPPKVTKQYTLVRKIWSCNFHPNQYHEKLVNNNFFSLYQVKLHRKFMEVVFEVAKWYAVHKGVTFVADNIFRNINVTVVVDPNCNRIVTIAYDFREEHPMQHSAMVAIDNVAKTQNGGVWSTECDDSILPGIEKDLIQHLKHKFSQFIIGLKKSTANLHGEKGGPKNDLRGGKGGPKKDLQGGKGGPKKDLQGGKGGPKKDLQGGKGGPKKDLQGGKGGPKKDLQGGKGGPKKDLQGGKGGPKKDLQGEKSGPETDLQGEKGGPNTESGEKDGPYLCTGYYIYMLKEPCMMCAMGLVHARAKRVFFCLENSVCGALSSVAKLQTVPSLNHHFEVFTGFL